MAREQSIRAVDRRPHTIEERRWVLRPEYRLYENANLVPTVAKNDHISNPTILENNSLCDDRVRTRLSENKDRRKQRTYLSIVHFLAVAKHCLDLIISGGYTCTDF